MPTKNLLRLALSGLLLQTMSLVTVHAQITIISSTQNDGGFESFTGNQFSADTASGNFTEGFDAVDGTGAYNGWFNLDGAEGTTATLNTLTRTGARAAYIASNASQIWGLNTGYVIQSGDKFSGSFWYRTAANAESDDVVSVTLFYRADNTLDNLSTVDAGVTDLFTYTVPSATSTYTEYSFSSGIVDIGAVGNKLMLRIEKVGFDAEGGTGSTEFARLDDLSLAAVPEPSTFALLASFATLGFVVFRRRRRQG